MAFLRAVWKLGNGVSGFSGFSGLSRRWNSSQTCVIRGTKQDITFPRSELQSLDDFEAQHPFVNKVEPGGLTPILPFRQYELNDDWRPILFSAFLHSHIVKSQGDCIVNPFDYGNVGVLRDINMLAFKRFERVKGKTNCNHMDFKSFVEGLFKRYYRSTKLSTEFPECGAFLKACKRVANDKEEDVLRHHSIFLQVEELANLYSDTHRLLRHELKHRGRQQEAVNILIGLGSECYSNQAVLQECGKHVLLNHLLGSHGPKPSQQGGVPMPRKPAVQHGGSPAQTTPAGQQGGIQGQTSQSYILPGTALVDVCRIAVQHSIEDNLLNDARKHASLEELKLLSEYTRADFIGSLRYTFGKYPGKALSLFKKHDVWDHLQMNRRLPTPSLLKYVTPDS